MYVMTSKKRKRKPKKDKPGPKEEVLIIEEDPEEALDKLLNKETEPEPPEEDSDD